MPHFGDQTMNGTGHPRFPMDGFDAITSDLNVAIPPYEQRKIQMTNMLRKLDGGVVHYYPLRKRKVSAQRLSIFKQYNAEVYRKKQMEAWWNGELLEKPNLDGDKNATLASIVGSKTKSTKVLKGEGIAVDLSKLSKLQKHKLKRKKPLQFSLSVSSGLVNKLRGLMPDVDPTTLVDDTKQKEETVPVPGDRDFWKAKLSMLCVLHFN